MDDENTQYINHIPAASKMKGKDLEPHPTGLLAWAHLPKMGPSKLLHGVQFENHSLKVKRVPSDHPFVHLSIQKIASKYLLCARSQGYCSEPKRQVPTLSELYIFVGGIGKYKII